MIFDVSRAIFPLSGCKQPLVHTPSELHVRTNIHHYKHRQHCIYRKIHRHIRIINIEHESSIAIRTTTTLIANIYIHCTQASFAHPLRFAQWTANYKGRRVSNQNQTSTWQHRTRSLQSPRFAIAYLLSCIKACLVLLNVHRIFDWVIKNVIRMYMYRLYIYSRLKNQCNAKYLTIKSVNRTEYGKLIFIRVANYLIYRE